MSPNFTVSQMATGQRYTGFFGTVTGTARVKNLTITSGNIVIPACDYNTSNQDADVGVICG